jgi:tetratricopeptide (TPR) repeat protein
MKISALMAFAAITSLPFAFSVSGQIAKDGQESCRAYNKAVEDAQTAREVSRNYAKAVRIVSPLLGKSPNCYNLNYSFGLTLGHQEKYKEAATYLKKARQLNEKNQLNDNKIYNSLGWAYLLDGQYAAAEEAFGKALSDKVWATLAVDTKRRVLNNSGLLYIYMGRYDEAEKNLKRAATEFGSTLAQENLKRLAQARENNKRK